MIHLSYAVTSKSVLVFVVLTTRVIPWLSAKLNIFSNITQQMFNSPINATGTCRRQCLTLLIFWGREGALCPSDTFSNALK